MLVCVVARPVLFWRHPKQNYSSLALFYCRKVTCGVGSFPLVWVLTAPPQAQWRLVLIRGAVTP